MSRSTWARPGSDAARLSPEPAASRSHTAPPQAVCVPGTPLGASAASAARGGGGRPAGLRAPGSEPLCLRRVEGEGCTWLPRKFI